MASEPGPNPTVAVVAGSPAALYCGRLLAGVGAEVTLIEPPGGDPTRNDPALFAAVAGGLSSRPVESGPRALDALVAGADLVVAGRDGPFGVGVADRDRWAAAAPGLVITVISPFGLTGPQAAWRSSDLVLLATSMWLHATGDPSREPLAVAGRFAELIPGLAAASASLMALRARDLTGRGQTVDVSQQEALLLCQPYLELGYAYTGVDRQRNGMPFPMTLVPAADGHLGINVITQEQWELLCAFAGRTDLLADERLATPADRVVHAAELTSVFAEWAADKDRAEVFLDGQAWRIPFGYVPRPGETPGLDVHRDRGFFTTVDEPGLGPIAKPALPFLIDGQRAPAAPAPGVGRPADPPAASPPGPPLAPAPAGGAGVMAPDAPAPPPSRPAVADRLRRPDAPGEPAADPARLDGGPLGGIRVVDLTMFWSGPLATELFAQYGADVVKVESVQRFDPWRGFSLTPGIESSPVFNGVNLNKHGITLDLASGPGRELLRRLVEDADVLVENFSTRVMGNFGLGDEVLFDWNPDLVILSMPAFGLTGPWRDFVGFAPTMEQLSGLPELSGYPDGPPALSGNSISDPAAGLSGCFALLAALRQGRTGIRIDLSQLEALTGLIAPELIAVQADGSVPARHGSASPDFAPQGCYPAAEPDTWIVLGAPDDAAFAALADTAAGDGLDLLGDPRFADPTSRRAHAAQLDRCLAAWTARHRHVDLARLLQAAGLPAAPVLRPSDLHHDAHLAARGSFQELDRDAVGPARHLVLPFRFPATPGVVRSASPTLGRDNDAILGGRLGLSAEDLAGLRADGIIGETVELDG
ncbi:MAG: CoA transferase [Acidimicrobiales bacterium]